MLAKNADYCLCLLQFILLVNRYLLPIYSVLDMVLGTGDRALTDVYGILVVFTFLIM